MGVFMIEYPIYENVFCVFVKILIVKPKTIKKINPLSSRYPLRLRKNVGNIQLIPLEDE